MAKALVGAGITLVDAFNNGPQARHAADLTIDAVIYGIGMMSGPAGWIIGGAWFFGNLIYEHYHDGKSITEDLLDGE